MWDGEVEAALGARGRRWDFNGPCGVALKKAFFETRADPDSTPSRSIGGRSGIRPAMGPHVHSWQQAENKDCSGKSLITWGCCWRIMMGIDWLVCVAAGNKTGECWPGCQFHSHQLTKAILPLHTLPPYFWLRNITRTQTGISMSASFSVSCDIL